jgi:Domain of unknown function (DUF4129)
VTSPARAGTSAVVAVLAAAGLLLVLVTWAASIGPDRVVSGGHVERIRPNEPSLSTSNTADPKDPIQEARDKKRGEPPRWLGAIAFALEILTVAVVLFLAGRLLRRLRQAWLARPRRRRPPRPEDVDFEVLDSAAQVTEVMSDDAEEQRTLLAIGGEPRNAIVECWDRFEQQAVRAGVERQPWQTTAEFVLGMLDLVGADRGAVARLADLYREARFSDHPLTDVHRSEALDALDVIHRSLRQGVGAR